MVALRTNGHEGLGVEAGLRHADAVDGKDPHLIQDALDHPLGLVSCRLVDIKVELGPPAGAFLLPLHEITWRSRERSSAAAGGKVPARLSERE